MSRSRHKAKARASGGKTVYAGAGSNVLKEAEERKRGGHIEGEGEKGKARHDHKARARGGSIAGRKRGGGIGSNLTPLSTAARIKEVTKGEQAEDMGKH